MPAAYAPSGGGTQLAGLLLTAGDLAFNAAAIYPATDTAFVIQAVLAARAARLTSPPAAPRRYNSTARFRVPRAAPAVISA